MPARSAPYATLQSASLTCNPATHWTAYHPPPPCPQPVPLAPPPCVHACRYYHTLPFLLLRSRLPRLLAVAILAGIEVGSRRRCCSCCLLPAPCCGAAIVLPINMASSAIPPNRQCGPPEAHVGVNFEGNACCCAL